MKPVPSAARTRTLLRVRTAARLSSRGALAALVGLLVVGILGMHALATHGTPATPAGAATMAMPTATSGHQGAMTSDDSLHAHEHPADTTTAPAGSPGGSPGAVPGSGHDLGDMVMLCVAMLAAAAVTLLLLLAVRIIGALLPAAFQPAAARVRARQWVRGTGPPHVWAFSVIRC
jgi:hypothetical protein